MNAATTEHLAQASVDIALRAAIKWLEVHDFKADCAALTECLRANVKIRMGKALHDAKEAIDCHMPDIAEQTFAAEMSLAGIDAAKESFLVR